MQIVKMTDSEYLDLKDFLQSHHQQRFVDVLSNGLMESGTTKSQIEKQEQIIHKLQQKASELFSKGQKVTTQELHYECRISRPAIDKYKTLWLPYAIGSMVAPSPNIDLPANAGEVVQISPIAPNVDSPATAPSPMNNKQKSEDARQKISKAVAELQAEGKPITQRGISKLSGVTVATIKRHSDLFALGGEQTDFLETV